MQAKETTGQAVNLQQISKSWGETVAVDRVDLNVEPGSFTVLLGPSGCGKSTTLRIIAGLELADSGKILIGGKTVNKQPPAKRDIAMVFQSYALFPHLSVAENILFGLKVRRVSKADQSSRLKRTAELLGLSDLLSRKPSQLSGGQQQRVALGRAIIAEKPICLMDEPLSNLDAKLRNAMRSEIRDLQQSLGFSMVYVTHDQTEAITMADQVVLMKEGRVEQSGTPRDIYEWPATAFVAGFIGTPPMNLIPANDLLRAKAMPAELSSVLVGVRPEHIHLKDNTGINASVEHVEYLGADVLVDCRVGDSTVLGRIEGQAKLKAKSNVMLGWNQSNMHFFDRDTGVRLQQTPDVFSNFFNSKNKDQEKAQ